MFITLIELLSVVCVVSSAVDTAWMNTTLEEHFSKTRHHVTNPEYKQQAKEFILKELKSYGLESYIHEFPTALKSVKGANVVGVLKGNFFNTSDDRIVGLMAHYDTRRTTPGVNDNGAAVVAMLQAAKHIATHSRNFTVVVAAVDFEETESGVPDVACAHICGSENLIKDWFPSFWLTMPTVARFIVMDTIMNVEDKPGTQDIPRGFDMMFPVSTKRIRSDGKRGNFLSVTGRAYDSHLLSAFASTYRKLGHPDLKLEMLNITALTGSTITEKQAETFSDLMRSDHSVLWKNGLSAIFLTDTANFRGYMRRCYHGNCDNMDRVTSKRLQFLAKTAHALIGTVEELNPSITSPNV